MKYALNGSKLRLRPLLVLNLTLFSLILAACSDVTPSTVETPSYDLSLSVEIDASSRQEEVAARYGGDVIVWRPEAGFAVLGLANSLSTQSLEGVEINRGQVVAPEAEVTASSVWGESREAWSGGREAWSGGEGDINSPNLASGNAGAWWRIDLEGGQRRASYKGAGVRVAVIDSGLDLSHPAFRNRLASAREWKDFVDGDNYPQEERLPEGNGGNYGHGTGVAGVVLQVAPNATILPLRVLDAEGKGDITDVAAAIDHAVAWGADVINLSLGTDENSEVLNQMIAYAAQRKIFVVASSGNTGDNNMTYPARNAKAPGAMGAYLMSVGSVNLRNVKSTFSTYGDAMEFGAPGERVYTAFPDNQLGYWSGTSFSAPMVTGTLALILGEDSGNGEVVNTLDRRMNDFDLRYIALNVRGFANWVLH